MQLKNDTTILTYIHELLKYSDLTYATSTVNFKLLFELLNTLKQC